MSYSPPSKRGRREYKKEDDYPCRREYKDDDPWTRRESRKLEDDPWSRREVKKEEGDAYNRRKEEDLSNEPSKVVFVNGLRSGVTEADFHDTLSQYGPIAYVLCLGEKALVEFETIRSAKECVMDAAIGSVEVAGYQVNIQFSKSDHIRRTGLESQYASNVLVVTVYNVLYPVTVDVIYQISSAHGRVMRIALIHKKNVQALIEFDNVASAKSAKHAMNGADIYSGCCTLKVEFSKVEQVNVTHNSHDHWDYTINGPTLPSLTGSVNYTPVTGCDAHNSQSMTADTLFGGYLGGKETTTSPPRKRTFSSSVPYSTGDRNTNYGASYTVKRKLDDTFAVSLAPHLDYYRPGGQSTVIMIYGLSQENFNCDKVFNLLCSYGDCLKVKFLQTNKESCMAEMKNETDASNAIKYLRGFKMFGNVLELAYSRKKNIVLPPGPSAYNLPDGSPYFKSFDDARNLRFSNPATAAKNRLAYPSKMLHFFSAPISFAEDDVIKFFEKKGFKPVKVSVLNRSQRSISGFAEFHDVSEALEVMAVCNHVPIDDSTSAKPYVFKLAFAAGREHGE